MVDKEDAALNVGVDVGSMTVKVVVVDAAGRLLFDFYNRHRGDIFSTLRTALGEAASAVSGRFVRVSLSGSAGMQLSAVTGLPFVQEVVACGKAVAALPASSPAVDVAIELGGEDAKILRFVAESDGSRRRRRLQEAQMNTACAAGTGAFIDQMASLLGTDAPGLDALAEHSTKLHPIASRCAVFCKSDVQPLLSEGARKEDVAASILQAVVTQTVGCLAGGKPIAGNVALLGGPLHFLPQLRSAFARTLKLAPEATIVPEHSHLLVAIGAAINASTSHAPMPAEFLLRRLARLDASSAVRAGLSSAVGRLPPLFESPEELSAFQERHSHATAPRADISSHTGATFLGIDAGSTTLKLVLINSDGKLLHSFYTTHQQGSMLRTAVEAVVAAQQLLKPGAWIARCCTTGYGEHLLKTALAAEDNMVETVAHITAARFFLPSADLCFDIGGQDLKCVMTDARGVVQSISLNEACSSGCGSFIQTLAESLGISISQFAEAGLHSRAPLDLGTRCTVFCGSRIKQAQKDGAPIEDISAGIAISVINNALFKVMRMGPETIRNRSIVVQGGTFSNDSVLRAMEQILGRNVVRPDCAGLMGALGAALCAKQAWAGLRDASARSTMLSSNALRSLTWDNEARRCGKCSNNCMVTVHRFSSGASHFSGNRCERGAEEPGAASKPVQQLPNLFRWQRERTFKYKPLTDAQARRGRIGVPRALDMADKFPFWAACLGSLGFQVVLSPESTEALFDLGVPTLSVEAACLPSKVVHGHILSLMSKRCPLIFFPCVPHGVDNPMPSSGPRNGYACPLTNSDSDIVLNACGLRGHPTIKLIHAPLPLHDRAALARRLREEIGKVSSPPPTEKECETAVAEGFSALDAFFRDVAAKGREVLDFMKRTDTPGTLVACRPYHLDPYLSNSVPNAVVAAGSCVLTVESVFPQLRLENPPVGFEELDIYAFDGRIVRSAVWAARIPELGFIHLLSFGCGIAPNTDDGVKKAMELHGHPFATIKLDQKHSIGAVRLRVRSLFAAMESRKQARQRATALYVPPPSPADDPSLYFVNTKACNMRKDLEVLVWPFSQEHAGLWAAGFRSAGYRVALFQKLDPREVSAIAMTYAHQDLCYGGWLIIGMYLWHFLKGGFDPNRTQILWQSWGGECTASWLAQVLKRALVAAGLPQVPVTSLSYAGLDDPGLGKMQGLRCNAGVCLGELMQTVVYRTRPYEAKPGSVDELQAKWMKRLEAFIEYGPLLTSFRKVCREIVADFDSVPLVTEEHAKPRVALLGTMGKADSHTYSKLIDFIEKDEQCEVVALDLMDYSLIAVMNERANKQFLSSSVGRRIGGHVAKLLIEHFKTPMAEALQASKRFSSPISIVESHRRALEFVSPSHHAGEGWVMPWHILHCLEQGINNLCLLISFQCVSIHVGVRGVLPAIQARYPAANIAIVDFDSSQTFLNQLNRIRLMLGCIPGRSKPNAASTIVCQPADIEDADSSKLSCTHCAQRGDCPHAPVVPKTAEA